MIRYQYNRQVEPPAPYVYVSVSRVDGSAASATVPALVDTGADKTVIPLSLADELGLEQSGVIEAAGLNHVGSRMPIYLVRIGIRDSSPVVANVLGAPGEDYILLGRDIINRHRITLDGPVLLCTIE